MNYEAMRRDMNYGELDVDLNGVHPTALFQFRQQLTRPPNIRLPRKPRRHRMGVMSFLFKYKYWEKIKEEGLWWEDLVWRLLLSYRNYMYGPWYSHAGRALTTLASITFKHGDMVESTRQIQEKIAKMNRIRENREERVNRVGGPQK